MGVVAFLLLLFLFGDTAPSSSAGVVSTGITAIVTTCGTPRRFPWVMITLRTYLSSDYDDVLRKVIVVWNSEGAVNPQLRRLASSPKLAVLEAGSSSLSNRWIKTIPLIRTDVVLNVDDDVVALKPAIQCMLLNVFDFGMVGPFARTVGRYFNYSTDERVTGFATDYALVLPRVALLKKEHLVAYSKAPREFLRYIDSEPAHSDDILLNLVVGPKKLRVIPPPGSVVDYDRLCHGYSSNVGLGTMKGRSFARTAAMRTMGLHYTSEPTYLSVSRTCDVVRPARTTALVQDGEDSSKAEEKNGTLFFFEREASSRRRYLAMRSRDVVHYEHAALTDDMYGKLRKSDADDSARAICAAPQEDDEGT